MPGRWGRIFFPLQVPPGHREGKEDCRKVVMRGGTWYL
jgi:hypothetical protein